MDSIEATIHARRVSGTQNTRLSDIPSGEVRPWRRTEAVSGDCRRKASTEAKNLGNGPKENLQTRQIP